MIPEILGAILIGVSYAQYPLGGFPISPFMEPPEPGSYALDYICWNLYKKLKARFPVGAKEVMTDQLAPELLKSLNAGVDVPSSGGGNIACVLRNFKNAQVGRVLNADLVNAVSDRVGEFGCKIPCRDAKTGMAAYPPPGVEPPPPMFGGMDPSAMQGGLPPFQQFSEMLSSMSSGLMPSGHLLGSHPQFSMNLGQSSGATLQNTVSPAAASPMPSPTQVPNSAVSSLNGLDSAGGIPVQSVGMAAGSSGQQSQLTSSMTHNAQTQNSGQPFSNSSPDRIGVAGSTTLGAPPGERMRQVLSNQMISSEMMSSKMFPSKGISSRMMSSGMFPSQGIPSRMIPSRFLSNRGISSGMLSSGMLSNQGLSSGMLSSGMFPNRGVSPGMLASRMLPSPVMSSQMISSRMPARRQFSSFYRNGIMQGFPFRM